jgi:hypothetical protein
VIVPETIVCDHGEAFVSHTFRASCRFLGLNRQPARKATPTDKPHIERTILSVGTLFAQYLAAEYRVRTRSVLPTAGARIPALNCGNT